MGENLQKGKRLKSFIGGLCFAVFGVCAFLKPLNKDNVYHIIFGAAFGLIFGRLFKSFLKGFLKLFNRRFKKENGKKVFRHIVDAAALFLAPFATMTVIAAFYLKWAMSVVFVSAAIMAMGAAAAYEMGKIKGKQEIRNTLVTTLVSMVFSVIWTVAIPYLSKIPGYIEGGVNLISGIITGGGV